MKRRKLQPQQFVFREFPILGFEFDRGSNAIYITVAEGEVDHTRRISDSLLVDVNKDGRTLGIEILRVKDFQGHLIPVIKDLAKTYPLRELLQPA